jgi:hypothetical protein
MNKHLLQGVVCGGIFAAAITWIAASDAMTEGGLALLASAVFGLAAGLCIGGLIAANFAMLAVEEKEAKEVVSHRAAETLPRPKLRFRCRGFIGNAKIELHSWVRDARSWLSYRGS